jgi:hypothetical protein
MVSGFVEVKLRISGGTTSLQNVVWLEEKIRIFRAVKR